MASYLCKFVSNFIPKDSRVTLDLGETDAKVASREKVLEQIPFKAKVLTGPPPGGFRGFKGMNGRDTIETVSVYMDGGARWCNLACNQKGPSLCSGRRGASWRHPGKVNRVGVGEYCSSTKKNLTGFILQGSISVNNKLRGRRICTML